MGPRPQLSFCACKTETLGPDLLVPMGPRPRLWFCACKTATIGPELLVSTGPSPHLRLCAFKTANLAPEVQVSVGPRPRLWICECITDQYDKSIWVPDHTCGLFMQNSVISTTITSLNGFQHSSMVFACKTASLAQK